MLLDIIISAFILKSNLYTININIDIDIVNTQECNCAIILRRFILTINTHFGWCDSWWKEHQLE